MCAIIASRFQIFPKDTFRSKRRLYATHGYPLPELWTSGIALSPAHAWNDYFAVGRLKPGITLPQAGARMNQISTRLERKSPKH